MTKVKAVHEISKNGHKMVKNGAISKKKHQKFKKTPKGKIALINGSQAQSNGHPKSLKNGVNPQSQKKSPKGGNKQSVSPRASTSGVKFPQVKVDPTEEKDDTDSSDEDINEGITIKEEVSAPEDEVDDDNSSEESSSEGTVKAILGKSLADETDEDDEEFDADCDAEAEVEHKGVKMFKGLKRDVKSEPSGSDDEEEEEEESEEDDEDEKAAPGLAALLGASIADESDDEEFEAAENTSDDDEVSDSDEEDAKVNQSVNSSVADSSKDDDEDDDEDEEDEEDDEDDVDSSPDLTALLGKSIADDEDDEDFEGEEDPEEDEEMSEDEDEDEDEADEDEDVDVAGLPSPSKKAKVVKSEGKDAANASPKSKELTKEEREERDKRTVFIGNVPKESDRSGLQQKFRKFGIIESMRLRGIVPENPKMSYKVAAITKKTHPKINTVCYFITYKHENSAKKALSMNGKKWDGNILRVDMSNLKEKRDKAKAVFLGNLPFTIEDNELWELFKQCGKIESVRIVRDRKTGLGRGFGYINFEAVDGAVLAMDLNGTTIQDRPLRIQSITPEAESKRRREKRELKRSFSGNSLSASPKKIKTGDSETVEVATRNSVNAERRKFQKGKKKRSQGEKQRVKSDSSAEGKGEGKYQGQKADAKKKSKQNKSAKKKKQMAAKLLAKPKKPAAK